MSHKPPPSLSSFIPNHHLISALTIASFLPALVSFYKPSSTLGAILAHITPRRSPSVRPLSERRTSLNDNVQPVSVHAAKGTVSPRCRLCVAVRSYRLMLVLPSCFLPRDVPRALLMLFVLHRLHLLALEPQPTSKSTTPCRRLLPWNARYTKASCSNDVWISRSPLCRTSLATLVRFSLVVCPDLYPWAWNLVLRMRPLWMVMSTARATVAPAANVNVKGPMIMDA
ncbi:hypothetical protein DFP72DRAFT_54071 [Ephemerocybe angulata]|uniref:Uncharacterized protein n=1 Tax=Ephemerocybe angulata TaxID=980116 RepID=A0A8H6HE33_9AGAR|nr:hypothetical protein DFP72DRAFT_54071 [Tulosesus angulatus]